MFPKSAQLLGRFRRDSPRQYRRSFCAHPGARAVLYRLRDRLQPGNPVAQQVAGRHRRRQCRFDFENVAGFYRRGLDDVRRADPGRHDRCKKIFNGNMSGTSGYTLNSMTAMVTKSGRHRHLDDPVLGPCAHHVPGRDGQERHDRHRHLELRRQYAALYRFLSAAGQFAVDGRGATPADVATMVNNTPDSCAFACHDLNVPTTIITSQNRSASQRGSTCCAPRPSN